MSYTRQQIKCLKSFGSGVLRAGLGLSFTHVTNCISDTSLKFLILENMKKKRSERTMTYVNVPDNYINVELVDIGLNEKIFQIGVWNNRIIFITEEYFRKGHWEYIIRHRGDYKEIQPGLIKIQHPPPNSTHGFRWEKRVLWGVDIEVLVDGLKEKSATLIQSYMRRFLEQRRINLLRLEPENLFDTLYSSRRKELMGIKKQLWGI